VSNDKAAVAKAKSVIDHSSMVRTPSRSTSRPNDAVEWQTDMDGRAGALDAFDLDAAAMQFDQVLGKRQAEAGALVFLDDGVLDLAEEFQCDHNFLGRHADASIGDAKSKSARRIERSSPFSRAYLSLPPQDSHFSLRQLSSILCNLTARDTMAQTPIANKGNFLHIYDFRVMAGHEEEFIRLFDEFDYSDGNPMHKSSAQVKDGVLCRDTEDPRHFYLIAEWSSIEEHAKIRKILTEKIKPEFIKYIEGRGFVPKYAEIVSSTPEHILQKAS
jgi:hypothetical protein